MRAAGSLFMKKKIQKKKKIRIPLPKQTPKKIASKKVYDRKKEKEKTRRQV